MCKMLNFVNFIICIATFSQTMEPCLAIKRGPHHPRSEQSKTRKVDQHLTHEEHRIDDDLKDMGINVNLEDMSDEEKNFYYFKIHDSDNNNALDGLEMLQAAIHQDEHFKKVDRDNFLHNASEELNHIIEVIDEFLQIADANKDGFLHYAEYVKAVTGAPEGQ
ncbi:multiple coagulation factor deficiency protein 2 homolog isoform X1 [Anastrepha obliqua]|uniref:multiple coagulation factor deficiency protein 2 homolog isoform X1 n=1 Tax=Anastrepha obliqua TaxID=95512 RepID=UPI0024090149|nr:multiple coagulation factor deficiency protein 2 homolog isoform X1 [Anastrepha obliqua]XP_054747591.1 multiple coagulation factor deficiency protein 2 homolog isoform X1 [Anastrepha obliqua]